jgi:hypothetical protein
MHNFLNVTVQFLGLFLTFVGIIVAILINWPAIKKNLKRKDIKEIKEKVSVSKRNLLKGIGAISVGALSWGLLQVKPVQNSLKKALFYFLPQGKNLVVNSKSGVIHHKILCADHLPSESNTRSGTQFISKSKFHSSHKVGILTKITENVSAEDAIEILLLAVEDNPTSVHIYDKIVKLLGKLKRFEAIHLLLENADNNLSKIADEKIMGSKEYKKYEKAITHVRLQRRKTRERARYSALNLMS